LYSVRRATSRSGVITAALTGEGGEKVRAMRITDSTDLVIRMKGSLIVLSTGSGRIIHSDEPAAS
jgi:hypothetical protein